MENWPTRTSPQQVAGRIKITLVKDNVLSSHQAKATAGRVAPLQSHSAAAKAPRWGHRDHRVAAKNNGAAGQARSVTADIAGLFASANKAAKEQVRLRRDDQYTILKKAYTAVRRWEREKIGYKVAAKLRARARIDVSPVSLAVFAPDPFGSSRSRCQAGEQMGGRAGLC